MGLDLAITALVFGAIFLVELPDKTFVATLVLATRYRPLLVWIGVAAAFLVQTVVAVAFGGLISRLPHTPVQIAAISLFVLGGLILLRGAARAEAEEQEAEEEFAAKSTTAATGLRAVTTSFLILFLAEWGDLSQLLTASMAAKYRDPLSVGVGAFLALATVSGLAAVLGRGLLQRLRLATLRRVGGLVCLALAVIGIVQLAWGS
jgi:putative Ca2+/H+ antiporter (TMEM165/GDT1 family)